MGGSSNPSSRTDTTNTTQVTDRRTVADGGAVVIGDGSTGNTITQTDHGAIDAAFNVAAAAGDVAKSSVLGATAIATSIAEQAGRTTLGAFDFAGQAGKAALQAQGTALDAVKMAYQNSQDTAAGNRTIAFVGLTIAGVLAVTIAMRASR